MLPATVSGKVGRPRAEPSSGTELSPREQILEAAATLFIELGFTATTTRAIAERVGVRQATLYYHFGSKDEMLAELLNVSLHPGISIAKSIEALVPTQVSPAAALHALAAIDAKMLRETTHNLAFLWLLPEVQGERYADFHQEGRELQDVFARLGTAAASQSVATSITQDQLGAVLIHLSELITLLRRTSSPAPAYIEIIAATCLRACGLTEHEVEAAIEESRLLRQRLDT